MVEIVPAIIPKSFEDLKEKALKVAPFVKSVQIDIMDGEYAPEPSFPFIDGNKTDLKENFAKTTRIGFELDMMVLNPEKYFDAWIEFGIGTFILHLESTDKMQELIDLLREKGKGVAIALKPSTSLEKLEPFMEQIEFVQFMGNDKIGYHGVELDEQVLNRIRDLRERHSNSIISIDIGVNFETAPKLIQAGASKLVSGSTIFNSIDAEEAIRKLSL